MLPLKFKFEQIADLQEDLRESPRALRAIVLKIVSQHLKKLRNELRPDIPSNTGAVRRRLSYSVRKGKTAVEGTWAIFGFLRKKGATGGPAVAANVLQKGKGETGARSKYGKPNRRYIWVPTQFAGSTTPASFRGLPNTFIGKSKAGNDVAFQRRGKELIPLFILKQRIKLSRPPLELEFNVEDELPDITADIQQTVKDVLEVRGKALRQLDGR